MPIEIVLDADLSDKASNRQNKQRRTIDRIVTNHGARLGVYEPCIRFFFTGEVLMAAGTILMRDFSRLFSILNIRFRTLQFSQSTADFCYEPYGILATSRLFRREKFKGSNKRIAPEDAAIRLTSIRCANALDAGSGLRIALSDLQIAKRRKPAFFQRSDSRRCQLGRCSLSKAFC